MRAKTPENMQTWQLQC